MTSKSAAVISSLRACHPSNPSFQSAVEKVFHDLAAIRAVSSSSLLGNSSTDSLPQRPSSTAQQVPVIPPRKVGTGGPATISEASFLQLLQQLSMDFPKPLQTRLLETTLATSTKETSSSQGVGLARFRRGVHTCLLMEELLDAATLLFQALEPNISGLAAVSGVVASNALMSALRSAATTQFPRELTTILAPLLARSSDSHTALASSVTVAADTSTPSRNLLQLNDVYELLLDLAFVL